MQAMDPQVVRLRALRERAVIGVARDGCPGFVAAPATQDPRGMDGARPGRPPKVIVPVGPSAPRGQWSLQGWRPYRHGVDPDQLGGEHVQHRRRPSSASGSSEPASVAPRSSASRRRSRSRSGGQSIVEFALVIPLFLTVALAIIEFAFAFHAVLAVNFASRTAALLAAEGGNEIGTDCIVLRSIESNITAPADPARITEVDIYQADKNGDMVGTATIYQRTGSTTCDYAGGTEITVPYTLVQDGYTEDSRCNILAGCGGSHPTLDNVGVMIGYHHAWITPLRSFVGGNPGGFSFDRSNATRMEPIL
jgi:Flp pilus assembly protein TadG